MRRPAGKRRTLKRVGEEQGSETMETNIGERGMRGYAPLASNALWRADLARHADAYCQQASAN
jgi:hypothetical protein